MESAPMGYISATLFETLLLIYLYCLVCAAVDVSYDNRAIKIDGKRRILISGSIHYPRSTPEMWPSLIKKAKDGGLDVIDTYIFWNIHEPLYRQYDFSGNKDFVKFFKTIHKEGLYAFLRIGPYVCAEWNFGGFPVWLVNMPNMTFRIMNDPFMDEVKIFTRLIIDMIKQEKLLAWQGGPIILAQIENEYGNINKGYGQYAKPYTDWCASYAESLNIGVPWIMCNEIDAPASMISSCNGWYCDEFTPKNPNNPKLWTEDWTGWSKRYGGVDVHRTAEDTAFAVAQFYQYGGTMHNYYMFHGGTNFGRIAGGPYTTTTYDCDGILDEFGNYNQPKFGHLKELHLLLRSMEEILTYGVASTFEYGDRLTVTKYVLNNGTRVCFFGSVNETNDKTILFEGYNYTIPAWSTSILRDCHTEVYNTAKVNTQTSVMVRKPNLRDDILEWRWKLEPFQKLKSPWKDFSATKLLDQKVVTNDTTDYLWYMTSVDISEDDPIWGNEVILQINSSAHGLYVFINEKHVGSHLSHNGQFQYLFEQNIPIKTGKNTIVLLSVTVGLLNYGAYFDKEPNGILGPVKLLAPNSQEKDLSTNVWAYKIGLEGLNKKRNFNRNSDYYRKWQSKNLPTNKTFVWYQTVFKTPEGEDPVELDLLGMGKGIAWVNGHNIGRYWPSYITDKDGCNYTYCDYRGIYMDLKCMTNCGRSTQRGYHVPRSFLNENENILVLFDEIGGNPSGVRVQTVTIGSACGNVYEGNTLELSCQGGRVISNISFASFGNPKGGCRFFERFKKGSCDSPNSLSVVTKACLGKERCAIDVSEKLFEPSAGCRNITRTLAVEAVC